VRYWLFKSEPDVFGFDRLKREGRTEWSGVRNYQARNNMREMRLGDLGFFYHSSTAVPGIAGVCKVVREAYPDFTAFDKNSEYYDGRSTPAKPMWDMVDVAYESDLPRFVSLAELRANTFLTGMALLRRGQRLSVQPVSKDEWTIVLRMAKKPPPEA
jgi:predicted RNA-binding protein with PUA-like domain